MPNYSLQEAIRERDALDGRIAFVTGAFVLAYAFVALLDRVGAPDALVAAAAPCFTVAALALLGFFLHSMRVSLYYTAGRAVPAPYAGFANAAILIALAAPFTAYFVARSWWAGLGGGFLVGAATGLLFLGPLLRKTNVFSLPGVLAARFPSRAARLLTIAVAAVAAALTALAGHQMAVDALALAGVSRVFGAFLAGVAILLIVGPGGLQGVIWAAAVAAGVAVAGFVWPLAVLGVRGSLPFSLFSGESWRAAGAQLEVWRVLPAAQGFGFDFAIALAWALGVAALAPVLTPAVTNRDEAAARVAGGAGMFWTLVLALLAGAIFVGATLTLAGVSVGQAPERLPASVYTASARGYVTICGERLAGPAQARGACAGRGLGAGAPLRAEDVKVADGVYLLTGLPQLSGLGASYAGLLLSALIALSLILAAAGLQACATAVGHEAFYRMRGEMDLTSRRLAAARVALVGVTAVGCALSAADAFETRALIGLALGLSAAAVAPVIALAFWPRAGDREATIALVVGLLTMIVALVSGGGALLPEKLALASLAGAACGGAAGALSVFATPVGAMEPGRAFLRRMIHGDGEILGPDKGA